jgi:uncharacterized membrane protein
MFAMMPIIIPMNTYGGGGLICNKLIVIVFSVQYMIVFSVLFVGEFHSKTRFFLNLIPCWFIIEFFIMIYNRLKEIHNCRRGNKVIRKIWS